MDNLFNRLCKILVLIWFNYFVGKPDNKSRLEDIDNKLEEDGKNSDIKSVNERPVTSNSAKSVDSRKLSIPASSKPDVWIIEEEKQVRCYN